MNCSPKDIVDALTTQNSELRSMLIRATETKALNPDTDVENAQRDSVVSGSFLFTFWHLI